MVNENTTSICFTLRFTCYMVFNYSMIIHDFRQNVQLFNIRHFELNLTKRLQFVYLFIISGGG